LFSPDNLDQTIAQLLSSQPEDGEESGAREAAKIRLAKAKAALRRFQDAIAAGIEPVAVVEAVNEAQAQRAAAEAELETLPSVDRIGRAEVYARLDSLGDVGRALRRGSPEKISQLYHDLGVELVFDPEDRIVHVTAVPRVVSECVRGGTSTPTVERSPLFGVITPKTIPVRHSCCHATAPVSSRPRRTDDVSSGLSEWGYIPTLGNHKLTIARPCSWFSYLCRGIAAGRRGCSTEQELVCRAGWCPLSRTPLEKRRGRRVPFGRLAGRPLHRGRRPVGVRDLGAASDPP
jgi:hypothetical protein